MLLCFCPGDILHHINRGAKEVEKGNMSLGACGDSIGLTLGSTLMLSIGQAPLFLFLVTGYPMVQADIFSTNIKLTLDSHNKTAIDLNDPIEVHYMHSVNISAAFLLSSALIAGVGVMTFQIAKQGLGHSMIGDEEYVLENVDIVNHPTVVMWNNAFVALVVWTHVVIIAIVCSPSSMHFLFMTALFITIAFQKLLFPHNHGTSAHSASSSGIWPIILYMMGMTYAASNIAIDSHMRKAQTIICLVLCDLGTCIIGHSWDRVPTFNTIINCRMVYLCFISIVNLALYMTWTYWFKTRFLHAPVVNIFE